MIVPLLAGACKTLVIPMLSDRGVEDLVMLAKDIGKIIHIH